MNSRAFLYLLAGFAAGWVYANRDTLLSAYRNRDSIALAGDTLNSLREIGVT